LDVIGIILIIFAFGFILAPLTIAGGTALHWQKAYIIAPLTVGLLCIPAFILWEMKGARHPLTPFHLLKDRGVWGALAIRCLLNFSWYLQADYLYTVLVVAFDFTVAAATRVQSFYSFFGLISGLVTGLIIYKVRKLKYFIVAGTHGRIRPSPPFPRWCLRKLQSRCYWSPGPLASGRRLLRIPNTSIRPSGHKTRTHGRSHGDLPRVI
jgi:hypothetical protein